MAMLSKDTLINYVLQMSWKIMISIFHRMINSSSNAPRKRYPANSLDLKKLPILKWCHSSLMNQGLKIRITVHKKNVF